MKNQYVLNAADQITSVGDGWDEFAIKNSAPDVVAKNVIGRRYWEFISGKETISYLTSIFFACRMDMQPFSILYRCDSSDEKRLFRLFIQPGQDKILTLNHQLIHSTACGPEEKVVDFENRYDGTRCSICCSFLVGDNWVDPFTCPDTRYFAKSYVACPKCSEEAQSELSRQLPEARVIPVANSAQKKQPKK